MKIQKIIFLLYLILIFFSCSLFEQDETIPFINTVYESIDRIPHQTGTGSWIQHVEYWFYENEVVEVYVTYYGSTNTVDYPNRERTKYWTGNYSVNESVLSVQFNDWEPWKYLVEDNKLIREYEILTKRV